MHQNLRFIPRSVQNSRREAYKVAQNDNKQESTSKLYQNAPKNMDKVEIAPQKIYRKHLHEKENDQVVKMMASNPELRFRKNNVPFLEIYSKRPTT